MFMLSVLCSEHYHFNIELFMKRVVRKVEPCCERIFKFSITTTWSQNPDAYGSQENDGKKLLPLVSGASKLFFLTLYCVLELSKSKPVLERIYCFKKNPKSYTPNLQIMFNVVLWYYCTLSLYPTLKIISPSSYRFHKALWPPQKQNTLGWNLVLPIFLSLSHLPHWWMGSGRCPHLGVHTQLHFKQQRQAALL